MGSDLYRVKVVEKQDRTVKLRVEVVHPDSNYLSDNPSFALMLLYEGLPRGGDAPLAKEISFDDTLDRGWLELYTKGFVEKVEKQVESGSSEGQTQADWIKGFVTITATDPAWVAHLQVGAEFDSRTFDVAWDFNDCAPIRPGQIDPNAPSPEPFISLPGTMWQDSGLPAVVRAPAYSSSAYHSPTLKKGTFTAAQLKDLDLQVVMYQGQYDDGLRVGILSLQGENVRIFTAGDGSYGSSSSAPFEGSIGKAELIKGKRLGSRLKVSRMLGNLQAKIVSATVEGNAATFRIAIPPGNSNYAELNDDQLFGLGFQLLVIPLLPTDTFGDRVLAPSPFSWTIEREVLRVFPAEERQMSSYIDGKMVPIGDSLPEQGNLAQRLARGFIAKTEVVTKAAVASSDGLDAMTEAQQRTALEAAWPEMVVKVTPHHAEYLQHLGKPIAAVQLSHAPEAQPWEGAPATPATGPTGFGQKKSPPPQAPAASSMPASSSSPSAPAKPNLVKIVGIVLAVLIGLCLLCMIGSAISK